LAKVLGKTSQVYDSERRTLLKFRTFSIEFSFISSSEKSVFVHFTSTFPTSISRRRSRVNINIAWFQSRRHQDRQEARPQSRPKLSSKDLVKDQPKGVAKYDLKPVPKIILFKDKKVAHLMLRQARLPLTVPRELDEGLTLCYKMLVSGGDRVSSIYKPTRQYSHVDQATQLLVSNSGPLKHNLKTVQIPPNILKMKLFSSYAMYSKYM